MRIRAPWEDQAMTVAELVEHLIKLPQDLRVLVYDGDEIHGLRECNGPDMVSLDGYTLAEVGVKAVVL